MAQVIIISGPQVSGWTKSLGSTTKIYLSLSSAEESVNTLIGQENPPEPCRELHGNLYETYRNLPGNCTRTCPKPSGTFLGTVQEPTVGELTLDLSPPERNVQTVPNHPSSCQENPPEPCRELHGNLSETYRNLPGNCTGTFPKPNKLFPTQTSQNLPRTLWGN
jgi:hypothetical protein